MRTLNRFRLKVQRFFLSGHVADLEQIAKDAEAMAIRKEDEASYCRRDATYYRNLKRVAQEQLKAIDAELSNDSYP